MKDSESAGGDRWRRVIRSDGVQRSVVPVGYDIGACGDSKAGRKIYGGYVDNEGWNPKENVHGALLSLKSAPVLRCPRFLCQGNSARRSSRGDAVTASVMAL